MGNTNGYGYSLFPWHYWSFGKKIPSQLKIFLVALAIADDVGAILVIALFLQQSNKLVLSGWWPRNICWPFGTK